VVIVTKYRDVHTFTCTWNPNAWKPVIIVTKDRDVHTFTCTWNPNAWKLVRIVTKSRMYILSPVPGIPMPGS
jgi:hypothetical protein